MHPPAPNPELLELATRALLTQVSLLKITALFNTNHEAAKCLRCVLDNRDIPETAKASYLRQTLRNYGADSPGSS